MRDVRNHNEKFRRSGAERQRRRRARQREGRRIFSIEADAAALEDALVRSRDLHPFDADNPGAVERALAAFLGRALGFVTRDAADF